MDEEKSVHPRRRWPWIVVGVIMVLFVALIALTPTILVSISYPSLSFDLAPYLKDASANLVSNKTVVVDFGVARGSEGCYVVHATGNLLDWPFTARVNLSPKFRFFGVDVTGDLAFRLDETQWRMTADFDASSSGEWRAVANMDATSFNEHDPVIGHLLSRLPMPAISNLAFNGSLSFSAMAERTSAVPVPKWGADCHLKETCLSCVANGKPLVIDNLRLNMGASGIADHVDIKPLFPHADNILVAGFTLTNVFASIRATERAYLVTEAGAGCCGGDLKLYSLFLDPQRLNAGVTLFVDGIDAGAVLKHLSGFRGEASGRLYGKLPLYLVQGRALRLRSAYLYSVPGETGNLKMYDSKPIIDNLAMGGVSQATCDNLSKALADLSYNVLKLSLQPEEDGGLALTLKLAGSSTHENVTVPVSLEVTFHGDIEQLVNTSFNTINRK